MIPLALMCALGGCLDQPIDQRTPQQQLQDQFRVEQTYSCYGGDGTFYKDCSEYDRFSLNPAPDTDWGML